eukprot:68275-Chlamydomonas_euryale.AAC.3
MPPHLAEQQFYYAAALLLCHRRHIEGLVRLAQQHTLVLVHAAHEGLWDAPPPTRRAGGSAGRLLHAARGPADVAATRPRPELATVVAAAVELGGEMLASLCRN